MKEQSMGQILRRIRIEQGMTQEALVEGICTAGYLSRVENGSQIPSRQIYQLLMERLGESGYSYDYWQEEEEKEQTCRELLHALQTWQKEHVDEKLLKLQKMKGAQDIRERQFYGMAHVIWLYMNEAIPQEDYLGCCRTIWESDAQGKTRRRQGMDKIEFAEMSEVQLWILNNLAIGHMWRGEYRESASILLRLCRYGQKSAEDVRLSCSVRAALCHNMAVCLLEMEKPKEALYFCDQAIAILQKEGGLSSVLYVLRLQMEAYRMLQDMDAYYRAQTLLHHLNCHLVKEKGSRAQIEKRLWDRRTLLVIF